MIAKLIRKKERGNTFLILNLGGKKGVEENRVFRKGENRKVNLLVRIPICTSRIRPARMLKFGVIA